MIIGSHNSWSYLSPTKWWMKIISFTARCQKFDIKTQYEQYGVRCFDLRVRFNSGIPQITHGLITYNKDISSDLLYLNTRGDCYIRVNLDTRTFKQYNPEQVRLFSNYCEKLKNDYTRIKFFSGEDLYRHNVIYNFGISPLYDEAYASISKLRYIFGLIPILYSKIYNKKSLLNGTSKEILIIDFVNIK